jgi:hypothetical protein
MEIEANWPLIKRVFNNAFKSSFHYAIASVSPDGEPHITPIGSLILRAPGEGFFFEAFTQRLPAHLQHNDRVCVLAVNSSLWFWLKSLLLGRFATPPSLRLYGQVGEARAASEQEIALWQRRVRRLSATRGHALMWRDMSQVREVRFARMEAVHIGAMTRHLWVKPLP